MIDTKSFILAGNATFTVTSRQTGTRFTYKVKKSDTGPFYYVSVLTGPDNWTNYKFFGILNMEGQFFFAKPETAKVSRNAPSSVGFAWLWRNMDKPLNLEQVKIHHEGKCCRCGRKLTVPESIESGVGPECRDKIGF